MAGWLFSLDVNWLPNLCLAGNPVTRIPDFVQPSQGCTKLFLAGNQINLTMNWLLDFMRVFLLKVMNNAFGFFLIVNHGYSSTD